MLERPISRRQVLQLAAAAVASASALSLVADAGAAGADTSAQRMTLEAWADTIVPGEKRDPADRAVAGACDGPGAVQAGVWTLMNDPDVGIAPILPALTVQLNDAAAQYAAAHRVPLDARRPALRRPAVPSPHQARAAAARSQPRRSAALVRARGDGDARVPHRGAARHGRGPACRASGTRVDRVPEAGSRTACGASRTSRTGARSPQAPATTRTGNPA